MNEIVRQILSMPPPFNMVVVIVVVVMGAGVIRSVAGEISKYAAHRESMEAIRDLAEHGMSAAEIERVLRAGSRDAGIDHCRTNHNANPHDVGQV